MNNINLPVPFFSQRENDYIWKEINENPFSIAAISCNITSVYMVLFYLGITQDSLEEFTAKIFNNYPHWNKFEIVDKELEKWDVLKKIIKKVYNVDESYLLEIHGKSVQTYIRKYLEYGYPLIFSNGFLSKSESNSGHISVIRGITNNGDIVINDPWGDPTNSIGLLSATPNSIPGLYSARSQNSDILYGKGSGDNCFISKNEIKRLIADANGNFHAGLIVTYPEIWKLTLGKCVYSFPKERKDEALSHLLNHFANNFEYVITNNGEMAKGVVLKDVYSKKIFSIGPGRIIAIKNTKKIEENFILVQYKIPGQDNKYVYINYKHLSFVDIEKEIENNIFSLKEKDISWLNQLLKKIRPKAAIFDNGTQANGKIHKDLGVPERGYIYLIPKNKELKNFIKDVSIEITDDYLYGLNDINNYKFSDQKNMSYFKTEVDGFEKKIKIDNLIPQTINYREFLYYRKKIKELINGQTVYFYDEDKKKSVSELNMVNDKNYKELFRNIIQDVFYDVDFIGTDYSNHLKEVEKKYLNEIKRESTKIDEFIYRCKLLCKYLLEIPWNIQEYAFTLNDNWFEKKTPGNFTSLYDVYTRVKKLFINIQDNNGVPSWDEFKTSVQLFYPSNVDFYLEVSASSCLGYTIKKEDQSSQYFTNVECFSTENVLNAKNILKLPFIYNKKELVKNLIKNSFFKDLDIKLMNEDYVLCKEIEEINKEKQLYIKNYAIYTDNIFDYEIFTKIESQISIGYTEQDKELLKKKKVDKNFIELLKKFFNINLKTKKFYYFNLIKVLEEFSERQNLLI